MTPLELALARIHADLTGADARFALIGGLAVSVRTEPRFTRDADLAVAADDDAQAEAIVIHLQEAGYRIGSVLEQHQRGRRLTEDLEALLST